jgi:DNA-directed RNA polymerase subunit RPC12/RpoP
MAEWKRDPVVESIVKYYDRPEKSHWSLLTEKEANVLYGEIRRCHQKGFVYTAANYFWIVDEKKKDVLFKLWEAQELILEEMERLSARGRPQRLFVLKARRLGCSTLIDAKIAYNCMFRENRAGIIISYNAAHSRDLFDKVGHIYDRLPWWLRPMIYIRKYDEGLTFDNPDKEQRPFSPGLNSRIVIVPANAYGGVGQGYSISDAHLSETSDWDQHRAREIIAGDLRWALTNNPEDVQVIETTGKGAGTFTEKLWQANYQLLDMATWKPTFLGWFFEKSRSTEPEPHWKPWADEVALRDRISKEWAKCDKCGAMRQMMLAPELLECMDCNKGKMRAYVLSDAQLRWYWQERLNAEKQGPDSVKELHQELAATPEDCFQAFGYEVFPASAVEWVSRTVLSKPLAIGNLDSGGHFHAVKNQKTGQCYQHGCELNHATDAEQPLRIWEFPERDCKYAMGVDVAEGIGQDYSVIWVNKVGASAAEADYHVATYRSNTITPWFLADVVNLLGRWYNCALAAVERTGQPTTADRLRMFHAYPNIFRWKHPDAQKIFSNLWHWVTRVNTKPWLIDTAIGWLQQHAWYIRDPIFAHEMKYFHREDFSSRSTGAVEGENDDVIMASLICLYCSHDTDIRDFSRPVVLPVDSGLAQWKAYEMTCLSCGREFGLDFPEQVKRCPGCRSILLRGRRNQTASPVDVFEDMVRTMPAQELVKPDTEPREWLT